MATNKKGKLPAGALANPYCVLQDESDISTTKENVVLPKNTDIHTVENGKTDIPRKSTSWSDEVDKEEITNKARFFVVKGVNGSLIKASPFLVHKSVQSVVGEVKNIKKLKSGDLLIEVKSENQVNKIRKMTSIGNMSITVSVHRNLNISRGVVSEYELLDVGEDEILENLRDQNVIAVKRISIRRDGKFIKTKHLILTFGQPTLPQYITAGYLKCFIRPFVANPLRCFKCQRFGLSKQNCRGKLTCARCATPDHESENCKNAVCCVNCKNDHPAYSRNCEKWIFEKEIQAVRAKQNLSYPEARKIVESRTPKPGFSYATAATATKPVRSICTQTPACIPKEPLGFLINGVRQPIKDKIITPSSHSSTLTSEDKIEIAPSKSSKANISSSPSKSPQAIIPGQQSFNSEMKSYQENKNIPSGSGTKYTSNKKLKPLPSNPVETRMKQKRTSTDNIKSYSLVPVKTPYPQNKKQLHKEQFLKEPKTSEEPLISLHASDEDEMSTSSESVNALGLPKEKNNKLIK